MHSVQYVWYLITCFIALQGCSTQDRLSMNLRIPIVRPDSITEHLTPSLSTRLKYFITKKENIFEIYDV